ncbi:MAG: hypothetical protein ABJF10_23055 [Chthoniobacter sp.]|uniref:hypothetical protein n=1 Tax=Chthoniobacter sp. TaxID=2510640 RepID=UPI0032A849DB
MNETAAPPTSAIPRGYSYLATGVLFALGGIVTAVFSGSLAVPAVNASLFEVLAIGMLVPSFTWLVQLSASALRMNPTQRRLYWGDLGRICLAGSVALLPGGVFNLLVAKPPVWISAANVLLSVAVMAVYLFRLTGRQGLGWGWAASWCATITLNMSIFAWSSREWWGPR